METSANNTFFFLGQSALIFLAVVVCSFLLILGIGYALHESRRKAQRRDYEAETNAEANAADKTAHRQPDGKDQRNHKISAEK